MLRLERWSFVSVLVLSAWSAAAASAQDAPAPRAYLGAHLALGFGGDADTNAGDLRGSAALDPTAGFGLRADIPLHDYVSVGGMFEALTFETESTGSGFETERKWALDFDVLARVRYPIELSGLVLEPYVALPFGLTIAMLDDPDGSGDEPWPGWNVGVLAGAYLFSTALRIGGFLELGWRHHQVYTESRGVFGGNIDIKVVTNQFAVNLGFLFVL